MVCKVNCHVNTEVDMWRFYARTATRLSNLSPPLNGFSKLTNQFGVEHKLNMQEWMKFLFSHDRLVTV